MNMWRRIIRRESVLGLMVGEGFVVAWCGCRGRICILIPVVGFRDRVGVTERICCRRVVQYSVRVWVTVVWLG